MSTTFTKDAVIDRRTFEKYAKTVSNYGTIERRTNEGKRRADLTLVSVQRKVNRTLRPLGLCLKSRNYYSEFYVVSGVEARKEVARYIKESKTKARHAKELLEGINANHVFEFD